MNPQQHLNDLFLADTYLMWREQKCSAIETVSRLRLYTAATGYRYTLKELFLKGGFTNKEYNRLLCRYNEEFQKNDS